MNETLVAVYLGILCAVMLTLLIWLIVTAVKRARRGVPGNGTVIEIDGKEYYIAALDGGAPHIECRPCADAGECGGSVARDAAADCAPAAERTVGADEIVLKRTESLSFDEAYPLLSSEQKRYVGEILTYAKNKEHTAKELNTGRYAAVYIGKRSLVKLFVRKSALYAKLLVLNNELSEYADSNKISIKEKPIDFKVADSAAVGTVKDIMDLTYRSITDERKRREEARRERRRARRTELRRAAAADKDTEKEVNV